MSFITQILYAIWIADPAHCMQPTTDEERKFMQYISNPNQMIFCRAQLSRSFGQFFSQGHELSQIPGITNLAVTTQVCPNGNYINLMRYTAEHLENNLYSPVIERIHRGSFIPGNWGPFIGWKPPEVAGGVAWQFPQEWSQLNGGYTIPPEGLPPGGWTAPPGWVPRPAHLMPTDFAMKYYVRPLDVLPGTPWERPQLWMFVGPTEESRIMEE